MNEVRIVNYTLIAAMLLLLATYITTMQSMAKINNSSDGMYTVTAFRI